MTTFFRLVIAAFTALLVAFPARVSAQAQGKVAGWSFDDVSGGNTRDAVSGTEDKVEGFYKSVPGATGKGLRFDGYTTSVVRKAENAPKVRDAFSVSAWVALDTYPWNWVPVVDQEEDQQVGYFLGIDAFGHVGLGVAVNGIWQSVTSAAQIPLKKWVHIVGTCDASRGLVIYLDGQPVGELAVEGRMLPADGMDLLIGRVRQPMIPVPAEGIHPKTPIWYSLDGILDEIEIYNRSLSSDEVKSVFAAIQAPPGEVLPWPKLPSGPVGPGRFGAYYDTLTYEDPWDTTRRIGPQSDVVVRFEQSSMRLVFWQGTNYIPAWVTENGKWYTDEFLETWGSGCPGIGDCEPMSDKQSRYSHVGVLESNDARVVVHWRYALAEAGDYKGGHPDRLTGWFDWADEYWTVYPDGVAVREQVLQSSRTVDLSDPKLFEWQETIVINAPGQRPEDNINLDALTIGNMKGETATYSWVLKAPGSFEPPKSPQRIDKPQNPNIQIVNLKSTWKPFQIVSPTNARFSPYKGDNSYFTFGCWNHWPVSQINSSDRPCVTQDRASHSSLSHIYWDAYATTEHSMTKLLLDGLTPKSAAELIPIAKSWLSPPRIDINGDAIESEGYDPAQRAFVVARKIAGKPAVMELTLQASESSPVLNPAIVVKNWGEEEARLQINGKTVSWGKDFRHGYIQRLEATDLVVWIQQESVAPIRLTLTPVPKGTR
jgi:hypothetical protein